MKTSRAYIREIPDTEKCPPITEGLSFDAIESHLDGMHLNTCQRHMIYLISYWIRNVMPYGRSPINLYMGIGSGNTTLWKAIKLAYPYDVELIFLNQRIAGLHSTGADPQPLTLKNIRQNIDRVNGKLVIIDSAGTISNSAEVTQMLRAQARGIIIS